MSPFTIISLLAEAYREQEVEETTLGLVSQRMATDYHRNENIH